MYLTEEEARKRGCPELLAGVIAGTASMAKARSMGAKEYAAQGKCFVLCPSWRWMVIHENEDGEKVYSDEIGYCGRGGKP